MLQKLENYKISIEYVPGKAQILPNALSRSFNDSGEPRAQISTMQTAEEQGLETDLVSRMAQEQSNNVILGPIYAFFSEDCYPDCDECCDKLWG